MNGCRIALKMEGDVLLWGFTMRRLRFGLLVFLFFPVSPMAEIAAVSPKKFADYQPRFSPFAEGEKAFYTATWNGIPIATARIESKPVMLEGKMFHEVGIRARTLKYIDLFWKMRDSARSVFEAETLRPHRFVFRQRENRKRVITDAFYDDGKRKWVIVRKKKDKVKHYELLSRNTLDPVTASYFIRSIDFRIGDQIRLDVVGGRSRYVVLINVAARERIRLKAEDFDTYKIILHATRIKRSGRAGREREATAWLSTDRNRRLLRVISHVYIGNIYIELAKWPA
jgi:hypothetical protein